MTDDISDKLLPKDTLASDAKHTGFPCPRCSGRSEVIDSRACEINGGYAAIRRRRRCRERGCGQRWTTWETTMAGSRLKQHHQSTRRLVKELRDMLERFERALGQEDAGLGGTDD